MNYTVIDLETTGFGDDPDHPIQEEPIELAALRVSPAYDVTGVFYCRWQPTIPVRAKAAEINGYTVEAWQSYPELNARDMSLFADFIEGAKWVGSNPGF